MNISPKISPSIKFVLLIALGLWAAVSTGRAILQSFSASGGNDLYTYWYAGHFIREGKDLFQSFINGDLPGVPVHYLDREVDSLDQVIFPGLVPAPASAPLAFYLMLPLAYFSWPLAKAIWLGINLLLLGGLPFLLVRFFDARKWLARWEFLALAFAMLGLTSTRFAAASGQITFLVLALMLGTVILADRSPWLAGLCLGLALSKYTLSIGLVVLFVLFEPKLRLILSACLVQLAGVVGLVLQSGSSLAEFFREYNQMLHLHANMEGIHLAGLFPNSGLDAWIGIGLTLVVAVPLALWRWRTSPRLIAHLSPLTRASLAVVLSLWSLLVVYHRAYDAMVIIVFLYLIACLKKLPDAWSFNATARTGIGLYGLAAVVLLMIPSGSIVRGLLPAGFETWWGRAANLITTCLILVSLAVAFFMLYRLRTGEAAENRHIP